MRICINENNETILNLMSGTKQMFKIPEEKGSWVTFELTSEGIEDGILKIYYLAPSIVQLLELWSHNGEHAHMMMNLSKGTYVVSIEGPARATFEFDPLEIEIGPSSG